MGGTLCEKARSPDTRAILVPQTRFHGSLLSKGGGSQGGAAWCEATEEGRRAKRVFWGRRAVCAQIHAPRATPGPRTPPSLLRMREPCTLREVGGTAAHAPAPFTPQRTGSLSIGCPCGR